MLYIHSIRDLWPSVTSLIAGFRTPYEWRHQRGSRRLNSVWEDTEDALGWPLPFEQPSLRSPWAHLNRLTPDLKDWTPNVPRWSLLWRHGAFNTERLSVNTVVHRFFHSCNSNSPSSVWFRIIFSFSEADGDRSWTESSSPCCGSLFSLRSSPVPHLWNHVHVFLCSLNLDQRMTNDFFPLKTRVSQSIIQYNILYILYSRGSYAFMTSALNEHLPTFFPREHAGGREIKLILHVHCSYLSGLWISVRQRFLTHLTSLVYN